MKTFRDFLVYYNNKDVGPFVQAIENMLVFYKEKELDIFKIAISLPGIARKMLFDAGKKEGAAFTLFSEKNKALHEVIKKNLIGGPSIIFTRYHKVGETMIRGLKPCQQILGFDANALYLWSFSQKMPVGHFINRCYPDFKPLKESKFCDMFYWMDYLNEVNNLNILHKMNNGKEKRIGPYFVDGFDASDNCVAEYFGCWHHGHDCINNDPHKEAKFERTQKRMEYIRSMGYKTIQIWECEFNQQRKVDAKLNHFIKSKQPTFTQNHPGAVTKAQILDGVLKGELYGMLEVDIHVPESKYDYFAEFSPIFCNASIPFDKIGTHMQEHAETFNMGKRDRKLLVGGMRANKILLASDLVKWYITHGIIVTHVHQVIEYKGMKCFTKFVDTVSEARRGGDKSKQGEVVSNTSKFYGNAAYGSTLMNKLKHLNIKYVQGVNNASIEVNNPKFRNLTEMGDGFFEIESSKKKIKMDVPLQIGYMILQYAKLRMLQFYYDCLDTLVDRSDFELIQMDTDSLYLALSKPSLEEAIKVEMMDTFNDHILDCSDALGETGKWFPRRCCDEHIQYDKRTPGLFKEEFHGNKIIALCSKTYIINNDEKYKFSCKGINKQNLKNVPEIYRNVLTSQKPQSAQNVGFKLKDSSIFTYTMERCGFTYYYCKREVQKDGIHTKPLDITLCP